MATQPKKVLCVLELHSSKSVIIVLWACRRKLNCILKPQFWSDSGTKKLWTQVVPVTGRFQANHVQVQQQLIVVCRLICLVQRESTHQVSYKFKVPQPSMWKIPWKNIADSKEFQGLTDCKFLQCINTNDWVVHCRKQNILVKTPYEWWSSILALCMGDWKTSPLKNM